MSTITVEDIKKFVESNPYTIIEIEISKKMVEDNIVSHPFYRIYDFIKEYPELASTIRVGYHLDEEIRKPCSMGEEFKKSTFKQLADVFFELPFILYFLEEDSLKCSVELVKQSMLMNNSAIQYFISGTFNTALIIEELENMGVNIDDEFAQDLFIAMGDIFDNDEE